MLRALFVQDWDPQETRAETWDRAAMIREVKTLRADHNFSPDTAIENVACVLRKYVDVAELERCLAKLPAPARAFWS